MQSGSDFGHANGFGDYPLFLIITQLGLGLLHLCRAQDNPETNVSFVWTAPRVGDEVHLERIISLVFLEPLQEFLWFVC